MRSLIVANWKMNTTLSEALILANGVKEGVAALPDVSVVLCPPFPWLVAVAEALHRHPAKHIHLGAQNLFWKAEGAYTGEVGAPMLAGLVQYAIVGHSERRRHFHETDQEIVAKAKLALAHKIVPIICIGELKKPTAAVLADPSELNAATLRQPLHELAAVANGLTHEELEKVVIAYEPVWAISGNKDAVAATGLYANQVAEILLEHLPVPLPVLYGGSVTATNAREFLAQPHISGLLVGGASLKIGEFVKICRQA